MCKLSENIEIGKSIKRKEKEKLDNDEKIFA
jgi:hypothetical protein